MALLPPMFAQNRTYSARVLRRFVQAVGPEGILLGYLTIPTTPVPTMAVVVSAGAAFIEGDDQADQGAYFVVSEDFVPLPLAPADPINARVDRVVLRVRDPQAGGPAGDDATLEVLTGTPAAVPTPQPIPDTAIGIADILVPAEADFIVPQNITDIRVFSPVSPEAFRSINTNDDVNIVDPQDGDLFKYNSATSQWENGAGELAGLNDVDIAGVLQGDILHYDGTQWVNRKPADPFFLMGA